MKNRVSKLLLASMMIFSILPITHAAATDTESIDYVLQLDGNKIVTASVPVEYQDSMTEQELHDIAMEDGMQNGDHFTITHVEEVVETEINEKGNTISPDIIINSYPTQLKKVGSEWAANTYFVISCAKGQTTTLQKAFTQTMKAGVSGSPYEITAELTAEITASYSVTHVFTGPEESSKNNSREYRVRFYAQTYDYTQSHFIGALLMGTKTGTVDKPTKWAAYNLDSIQ